MMNPIASEAIFSATYVDNYIDSVENLPDDVQRQLSRIRDIDVQYRTHLRDVDHYYDLWKTLQNSGAASANRRSRAIVRMQQSLIHAQELGDEKMQIVNQLQELIDHKTRQLDSNQKNLDIKEEQHLDELQFAATPSKGASTQSPTRDNVPAASQSTTGDNNLAKEHAYGAAVNSAGATNGSSTPTADRSAHVTNSAQQSNANGSSSSVLTSGNNSNLNAADSQRSASKRSRRRIEITHMELCGNESNSAIETASADKNCTASALGQKQSVSAGCSSSTQKKHAAQGLNTIGSVAGGTLAAGGIVVNAGAATNNSSKKKKRKSRGAHSSNAREETPPPDPIDPDEPTYCLCDQISFGEMILCDNDLCPIEWFHFSCVSLVLKPKGKWYCPNCRGDRPNLMKPKAQFLKELERYNKEKEEKT